MAKHSRSDDRNNAFIAMFATSFYEDPQDMLEALQEECPEYKLGAFGNQVLAAYRENAAAVDGEIEKRLKGWRVERLSRVSLAILRLAVAEMLYIQPGLESVVINEAVELSKKYGDEKDYQFVNGVLGNLLRSKEGPAQAVAPEAADADALP